jgi:selenocysteine-specific elongation factor
MAQAGNPTFAMDLKHIIVGTAGHIDHGKSTLVEALTGTHPDRLEEEKRRGITIDLGFAFLNLDGARLAFVDVPGHERFVRNMLAGAGGIDVVLLVVAADESIKPQTREHFDICRLLGIQRGVIAITKADLVDPEVLGLVRLEIEDLVRGSFLSSAPVVPVSARAGAGLDALRSELLREAQLSSTKNSGGYLRLPIDRSFAMKGFGTVVTGTLISGTVRVEDEVELYPVGKKLRVRGLHSGGSAVERALAGQRTAVNLAGIDHGEIVRGMSLGPPGFFIPTDRVDVRLNLLPSVRPLKNRSRVHFHQGTTETLADLILIEGNELVPGTTALAQLRLKEKSVLLVGDRFVLRQFSPVVTIGGGSVIEARPSRHRKGDLEVVSRLAAIETGSAEERLYAMLDAAKGLTEAAEVAARTGWSAAEVAALAKKMDAAGLLRIVAAQPLTFAPIRAMKKCLTDLQQAMDTFHRENPLLPGIPKQDLRGRAGNMSIELFETGLHELLTKRALAVSGDIVMRAGREVSLAPDEARAKELIAQGFERAGLTVPSVAEILGKLPVESGKAQKILQMLLREKVLVKISENLVFHSATIARLRDLLIRHRKERGEKLSISAFKELTGISRKYAIPLLEYLDRQQLTRRIGDERVIM